MRPQDQQIGIRFVAAYVAGIAGYLAIAQYLFARPAMIMGLIFFLLSYIRFVPAMAIGGLDCRSDRVFVHSHDVLMAELIQFRWTCRSP